MLNEVLYKCHSCKLYLPQQKTCQLMIPQMQGQIQPDDYCSQHKTNIEVCDKCGSGLLVPFIQQKGDTIHVYCGNCISQS